MRTPGQVPRSIRRPRSGQPQRGADSAGHRRQLRLATATGPADKQLIAAFGGRENLRTVDACITRLRMGGRRPAKVDRDRLKALGAASVIEVGNSVQAVVFGTQAEALKERINDVL